MAKQTAKAKETPATQEAVVQAAVTGVTLTPETLAINPGDKEQLTATVEPDDATDKTVSFSSDAQGVAVVIESGEVTGIAEGDAVITVTTTDGSFTDTCAVSVAAADLPIVDLSQLMADHWPVNSVLKKSTVYLNIEELTLETDQLGKLVQTPEGFVFERIDLAVLKAPETAVDLHFATHSAPLAEFTVAADADEAVRVDVTEGITPGTLMEGTWINITNQGDRPTGYGRLALSIIGYTLEPWR